MSYTLRKRRGAPTSLNFKQSRKHETRNTEPRSSTTLSSPLNFKRTLKQGTRNTGSRSSTPAPLTKKLYGGTYFIDRETPLDKSGRLFPATHFLTGEIKNCQILSNSDLKHIRDLKQRLTECGQSTHWPFGDIHELTGVILPHNMEIFSGETDSNEHYCRQITHRSFGSLHGYVQGKKKLPEHEARILFAQIVRIVAFCHANGVLVRDLKLRKFVFTEKSQTKLRLVHVNDMVILPDLKSDRISDRHGCPAYVSPEILNVHERIYSGKSADVWSLGVLLFVMLLGRYPFYCQTPAGLFQKIRQGIFYLPPDGLSLTPEPRVILKGLLRLVPEERPSASLLMAIPWLNTDDETSDRVAQLYIYRLKLAQSQLLGQHSLAIELLQQIVPDPLSEKRHDRITQAENLPDKNIHNDQIVPDLYD